MNNLLDKILDKTLDKIITRYKSWLVKRRYIKKVTTPEVEDWAIESSAKGAFKGTILEDSSIICSNGELRIYDYKTGELTAIGSNLVKGTLPNIKIKAVNNSTLIKIQDKFSYSYEWHKESRYYTAAIDYIKRLLIGVVIFLVIIAFGSYKVIHHINQVNQAKAAIAYANRPSTRNIGSAYTIVFPCRVAPGPGNDASSFYQTECDGLTNTSKSLPMYQAQLYSISEIASIDGISIKDVVTGVCGGVGHSGKYTINYGYDTHFETINGVEYIECGEYQTPGNSLFEVDAYGFDPYDKNLEANLSIIVMDTNPSQAELWHDLNNFIQSIQFNPNS